VYVWQMVYIFLLSGPSADPPTDHLEEKHIAIRKMYSIAYQQFSSPRKHAEFPSLKITQPQLLQANAVLLPRSEKLPLVNKFLYEYLFWKAHTHVANASWNKVYINRRYRPTMFQIEDHYVTQILTLQL
jgi:hypothetical protein